MKYDLVVFDLDGTVLNTLQDLAASCNYALSVCGYPVRTVDEVRRFVGSGIARLIELAIPKNAPEGAHAQVLSIFKEHYAVHSNDTTKPYPGIPQLLAALRDAGVHVTLNSNKIDTAVQPLCALHFAGLYEAALGEQPGVPRKPAPDGVHKLMDRFHADPARTLYIGDSQIDILTAQNAGVDCAWVSWGFRKREELGDLPVPHAFDNVQALQDYILG